MVAVGSSYGVLLLLLHLGEAASSPRKSPVKKHTKSPAKLVQHLSLELEPLERMLPGLAVVCVAISRRHLGVAVRLPFVFRIPFLSVSTRTHTHTHTHTQHCHHQHRAHTPKCEPLSLVCVNSYV